MIGVLPILKPMPLGTPEAPTTLGVSFDDADGAYFQVLDNEAQIVVIGPMHFSPSSYLEAFNDLFEERFEIVSNSFLAPPAQRELAKSVLHRGFVSIRLRKED